MRILWVTFGVLVIDQFTKVLIKGSAALGIEGMTLGESIPVIGDWFRITFAQNPGMAFGLEIGPRGLTTVIAIVATILIILYLFRVRESHWGYRTSLALILGGAVGNIIDRVFYAVLYNYGGFFEGEVVDFIHFNIWQGTVPESVPLIGGMWLSFFPIWNVADMSIVVGVFAILLFQKKFYKYDEAKKKAKEDLNDVAEGISDSDIELSSLESISEVENETKARIELQKPKNDFIE